MFKDNQLRVFSLADTVRHSEKFETVVLDISQGWENSFCNYTSIGYANLLAAYVGYLCVQELSGKKLTLVDFHDLRVFDGSRNPLVILSRSNIKIPRLVNCLDRLRLRNKEVDASISYIDLSTKSLHLSTQLINEDPSYFDIVRQCLHKIKLKNHKEFSLNSLEKSSFDESFSIGVHVRRGDFGVAETVADLQPCLGVPIGAYLSVIDDILEAVKNKKILSMHIYSDDSSSSSILYQRYSDRIECFTHSSFDSGRMTFNKMMKNDILINGNSTLSAWASVLSGNISIYPDVVAGYRCHEVFSDRFISFSQVKRNGVNFLGQT